MSNISGYSHINISLIDVIKKTMKNTNKKIYIINGVMGVIGSPIFTYLAQQKDTIVYKISLCVIYK